MFVVCGRFRFMSFAEFLIANQNWVAPIIEWGGALVLFALVILPFVVIRHRFFKPTRWWTIVGAYISSFVIYIGSFWLIGLIDQWLIQNYLNSVELSEAYDNATLKQGLWLLLAWPFLIFYSTKLMYDSFTEKRFWASVLVTIIFVAIMLVIVVYVMMVGLGQISKNF